MTSTLWQMFVMLGIGVLWRYWRPAGISAEAMRSVLTNLVYHAMLPALVIEVLWKADVGVHSFQYTLFGGACLSVAMVMIWLCSRILRFQARQMGAVILAATFPNVTYLGLPVLEQTFGTWARSVAIQIDLFAAMPAVLTAGIMVARHFGRNDGQRERPLLNILTAPPFLAAVLAVALNLGAVPAPLWLMSVLQRLAAGVVPLMLISLGLALSWRTVTLRNLPFVVPVVLIKLILMPAFALWLSRYLTLDQAHKHALVLEMAMPSMMLGIVFCERYQLDSALYAMAVTITTLLSLVALPYWYQHAVV